MGVTKSLPSSVFNSVTCELDTAHVGNMSITKNTIIRAWAIILWIVQISCFQLKIILPFMEYLVMPRQILSGCDWEGRCCGHLTWSTACVRRRSLDPCLRIHLPSWSLQGLSLSLKHLRAQPFTAVCFAVVLLCFVIFLAFWSECALQLFLTVKAGSYFF